MNIFHFFKNLSNKFNSFSKTKNVLDGSPKAAFTLVEMIIAITVFTIFIGFAMSTYIAFHRANQEAAVTRSLMLEANSVVDLITETVKENKINYGANKEEDILSRDLLSNAEMAEFDFLDDFTESQTLNLISADGDFTYVFDWNEDEEELTLQVFDEDGLAMDGYTEPLRLHGEDTSVEYVSFRVFPVDDPYDGANAGDDEIQYQPNVKLNIVFTVPGHVREDVSIDFQTTITSRFYQ